MNGMAKSDTIARILTERILHGDYTQRELPTEIALAAETGTSRPTARKALQMLIDEGLLVRASNGRTQMTDNLNRRKLQICLLGPAFASDSATLARMTLDHMSERFNCTVRSVEFIHWNDASISEVLASFDGVFLMASAELMPPELPQRLREGRAQVVHLFGDLSSHGIPSIDLSPVRFFQKILDHLYDRGHRRIDCLNTQPVDLVIQRRLEQWRLWCEARGIRGELLNQPVENYQDPVRGAYEYVSGLIRDKKWDSKAVWCTTIAAAVGVNRALHDAGLRAGVDVDLAGANDDKGESWVYTPSLTVVRPPDPAPYMAMAIEWMAGQGKRPWLGPLLASPDDIPLFIGESTGGAKTKSS